MKTKANPTSRLDHGGRANHPDRTLSLTYFTSNEEFQDMREQLAQLDVQQQTVRTEYEAGLKWVLAIMKFNPTAVLDALGVECCRCCGGCCRE